MNRQEINLIIGGQAGQGTQTIGYVISKVFARMGLQVFFYNSFESRIRGGHSYVNIRAAQKPIGSHKNTIDVLVALDENTLNLHSEEVTPRGILIYDGTSLKVDACKRSCIGVPFVKLAKETGDMLYANSVAAGALTAVLGLDLQRLQEVLKDSFKDKPEKIINDNLNAAKTGFDFTAKIIPSGIEIPRLNSSGQARLLMNSAEAVGLGALAGGVKFYSAYPMTPSTGVLTYLAENQDKFGIVVEQAEDEISAINMALGASYAGARAMTGTSGGGFALMVEGVSLAGMTEVPIVILEGQRPGPATGLPTRTEQGDLRFVLHAGHGEFPKIIFAPGTPGQAYALTRKALDLADKYQIPVFVMIDQLLADCYFSEDSLDTGNVQPHYYHLTVEELDKISEYRRYLLTPDGISPRALPMQSKHLVVVDSDEHDEWGHLTEDLEIRKKMVEKRLKKYEMIKKEVESPSEFMTDDAETILLGWGSTYGAIRDAVLEARDKGRKIGMVHLSQVWPLPEGLSRIFDGRKKIVVVENNATAQLAGIIRQELVKSPAGFIGKYDGKPFTADYILERIK
jgi:2-oxoglutarate/2-oxoacid ferredoxin oxidoreductase subunit alpha